MVLVFFGISFDKLGKSKKTKTNWCRLFHKHIHPITLCNTLTISSIDVLLRGLEKNEAFSFALTPSRRSGTSSKGTYSSPTHFTSTPSYRSFSRKNRSSVSVCSSVRNDSIVCSSDDAASSVPLVNASSSVIRLRLTRRRQHHFSTLSSRAAGESALLRLRPSEEDLMVSEEQIWRIFASCSGIRPKYEMNCGQNENGPLRLTPAPHAHEKSSGECTTSFSWRLLPDAPSTHSAYRLKNTGSYASRRRASRTRVMIQKTKRL